MAVFYLDYVYIFKYKRNLIEFSVSASNSDGTDWRDIITSYFETVSEGFLETDTKIKKKFGNKKASIAVLFYKVEDAVYAFSIETRK